jgi:hypothetical protein
VEYVPTDDREYRLHRFAHYEGKQFQIELIDGPAQGTRPARLPAYYLAEKYLVTLASNGLPFIGKGLLGGEAIYRRVFNGGRWKYELERIDTTDETIVRLNEQQKERALASELEKLYSIPGHSANYLTPKTGGHTEVTVEVGHRKAQIDALIAPVIQLLWRLDIDTLASCQSRPEGYSKPGWAYIEFWREDDGRMIEAVLTAASIPCECVQSPRMFRQHDENGEELLLFVNNEAKLYFAPSDMDRVAEVLQAEVNRRQVGR